MSTTADECRPERLLKLLTEQRELYGRLRELSARQRELLSGDHPEQLLGILRERQALVAALARLNEELAPFRRNWEHTYRNLPDDVRRQAGSLLQEINELLRHILRSDQEDSALLAARKQAAAERITEYGGGQSANAAYARQAGSEPPAAADLKG